MVRMVHYAIAGESNLNALFEVVKHQGIDKIIDMRLDAKNEDPNKDWRSIQRICKVSNPRIEYQHLGHKVNVSNPELESDIENQIFEIIMEAAEKSVMLFFDDPEQDEVSQFDIILFFQNSGFTIIKLPECATYSTPKKK